jgi:O-acetyl-ADP-ribose deacetylase (regulator of RNase III)
MAELGGCPSGEARITPGFRLQARYVIHAVGPVWHGGGTGEEALLESAYRSALALAQQHGLESIAFPAISTGVYGFPLRRAAEIAVETCRAWQHAHARPSRIVFCVFGAAAESAYRAVLDRLAQTRQHGRSAGSP